MDVMECDYSSPNFSGKIREGDIVTVLSELPPTKVGGFL